MTGCADAAPGSGRPYDASMEAVVRRTAIGVTGGQLLICRTNPIGGDRRCRTA